MIIKFNLKKMKKLLYIILVFWGTIGFAQTSLDTYLLTAAENNSALRAIFYEYNASLEKVPQVGVLLDPMISFSYFILPIETRNGPQNAKISITQMFPWFGTLSAQKDAATMFAKAKYEIFEDAKSKLSYEVKASYYKMYFTQKAIGITQNNLSIVATFKNLANIKLESGSVSALDVYRVEMEINDLENQLALLKDNLFLQQVQFNNLLNVPEESLIVIDDTLIVSEELFVKAELKDSINLYNNVLKAFDLQIDALHKQERVAQKKGMPQISLGLDYAFIGEGMATSPNSGQDALMFPMIGISVPLYRAKYKAMIQEVRYMQQAKAEEKIDKSHSIQNMFEMSWRDYQDAERRLVLYVTQADLAQKSMSLLETAYASNTQKFEEVLRMERKLLSYSLELQKASVDKLTAKAFMTYLQGN